MRYLGCGWVEAHHLRLKNGETYTSLYLFRFLKESVIPLEREKGGIPDEPPLELPSPPEMTKMGTTSELALSFKTADSKDLEQFRREANEERDAREARGEGNRYSEMQPSVMPKMQD